MQTAPAAVRHRPVKRDVIFNSITSVWVAVLGFLFAPVYVRYLGIEAYGLVGLLAALQSSFGLLDFGLSQVLGRELAQFKGGSVSAQSVRNLVRSVEVVSLLMATCVGLAIALPASWIAQSWIKTSQILSADLTDTIKVMGVLVALRFLEGLYRSALVGLHRQVALNGITTFSMTLRSFGAVVIVVFLTQSIQVFFLWQALTSAINIALMAVLVYRALPEQHLQGAFSLVELSRVSRFAGGITAVSILTVALSQTDKLILSNLLQLKDFGEYALATTLAMAPAVFVPPIAQAAQPRLAMAAAQFSSDGLSKVYHETTQLMTVSVGSAAIVVSVYSHEVLMLWLHDPSLADHLAPLVSILAIAILFSCLAWLAYALQLAHGWTGLTLRANLVAVILLVPSLLTLVPRYGSPGAAWFWLVMFGGLFLSTGFGVLNKYLPDEKVAWFFGDVVKPLLAAASMASLVKFVAPAGGSFGLRLSVLALASAGSVAAAVFAAPRVRVAILGVFRNVCLSRRPA